MALQRPDPNISRPRSVRFDAFTKELIQSYPISIIISSCQLLRQRNFSTSRKHYDIFQPAKLRIHDCAYLDEQLALTRISVDL